MTALVRGNWNIAGVEYPVGAAASGLVTVNSTIPFCNTSNNYQGLCLNATSYGQSYPNDVIICQTGQTCTNVTGIDFTGYVVDALSSKWSGACFFQNDRFVNTLATDGTSGLPLLEFETSTTCTSITIDHTDIDLANGALQTGHSFVNGVNQDATATDIPFVFTYDWFHDVAARSINAQFGFSIKYSYSEGFDFSSGAHGELDAIGLCDPNSNCPSGVPDTIVIEYNTALVRSIDCGGNTTIYWMSRGGATPNFTGGANIENNTNIDNACSAFTITNVAGTTLTISVPAGYSAGLTNIGTGCTAGAPLMEPWGTLQGQITTQLTGTNCLSGTYTYTGSSATTGTAYIWNTSPCASASFGTGAGPLFTGTVNILNNYGDLSGNGNQVFNTANVGNGAGACDDGALSGATVNKSGNVNMNLNAAIVN